MARTFLSKSLMTLVALSALVASAAPAVAQITTFATFSSLNSTRNIQFLNQGTSDGRSSDALLYTTPTGSTNTLGSTQVNFSFLQGGLSTFVSNVVANFTMSAAVAKNDAVDAFGNALVQPILAGTMSFTTTSAITLTGPYFATHTYAAGANLLTVVFDGSLFGSKNGTTANLGGSSLSGNSVMFTSDFLDFSTVDNTDLAASFTALNSGLKVGDNGSLASFRATGGGQFSSDPAPTIIGMVPEPASWAMMVAGFGMLGIALRRRAQAARAAA